jgi:hypothetical protein
MIYSETRNMYIILNDQKNPFLINCLEASLKPQNFTPAGFRYNVVMTTMALVTVVKQNTITKGCGFEIRTFSVQLTIDVACFTAHTVSNVDDKPREIRFVRQSIAWNETKVAYKRRTIIFQRHYYCMPCGHGYRSL